MRILTRDQILAMHGELIAKYGGSSGLRDEGLFESALAAPHQTFDGQDMLPTVQQKATRIGYGLITNHPFIDGNKRIGAHALIVTLAMNGIELEYTQKDLYEIILEVASGKTTFEGLLEWVLDHQD
jgi:death-on-curing protein